MDMSRKKIPYTRVPLPLFKDERGTLIAFEENNPLPFPLKRGYLIKDVPKGKSRAEHAISCDQFLVLLTGQCRITLRSKMAQESLVLDNPHEGLLVPMGIWMGLNKFENGASLLIFASSKFSSVEYYSDARV